MRFFCMNKFIGSSVQTVLVQRRRRKHKKIHASASVRKKANQINFLMTDEGVRVDKNEDMGELVRDYFQNVFGDPGEGRSSANVDNPRKLSYEQNKMLIREVSFEEFTVAVHQMHPDKASRPVGLNPAFFQNIWKILGKELFECFKDWLQGNCIPVELNNTNIVLIPKKDNARFLKDLQPIALCNVLYKIMVKVLANRLKEVLPGLISEKQSAFMISGLTG